MNNYVKQFFIIGLMFAGFGPIISGIVLYCVSLSVSDFSLSGAQVLLAIISTYLLAFLHAGASVFNQIEHWPLSKSILCHFATLYLAYTICYLINTWIPFNLNVIIIYTLIFIAVYAVIWLTVYICTKSTQRKLNEKIK